jgi:hypothetical protein
MFTWKCIQCNPSKMTKDQTCYNLNGFIKFLNFWNIYISEKNKINLCLSHQGITILHVSFKNSIVDNQKKFNHHLTIWPS